MKDLHEDDMLGSVRERLGRYEEAPSAELWGKIAASQQNKKERVWPVWVEAGSLVAMAVMLYSLTTSVVVKQEETKRTVTEQNPLIISKSDNQKALQENSVAELLSVDEPLQSSIVEPPQSPQLIQIDSASSPIIIEQEKPVETTKPSKTVEDVIPPYKKPKSKFQFYLSITPSLSFQKIIPDGNDALIVEGLESRSPLSMKRFGFGIDAGFQRDINNIFGFYGGLSFYRQDQQLTYRYYDKEAEVRRVGDSWTFEITRQQQSKTFDYTMSNIGVSSGVLVTLKGDKLKHKLGAGLLFSQGFAKATDSYNNSRSSYLSYQVFYRNEVKVNDRFSWFVEPTFIYSFISNEKLSEPFGLKPYRVGIRGGVLYRF